MFICGILKQVVIIALLPIIGRMSGAGNSQETSCGNDKNWAVVPYTLTQNMIFPSFNEKVRRFNFKSIEDEIKISQNWDEKGVSAVVWEAAVELTNFISENINVEGKKVLELGAGTGLVGIACAKLGADVTVTDLNEALPFLSKNVEDNFNNEEHSSVPKIQALKWGKNFNLYKPNDYDFIIGADVIYIEDTFDDLLDTISHIAGCKGHGSFLNDGEIVEKREPSVFLSAKMRYSREAEFINRMKNYFDVNLVFSNATSNINIYEAKPSRNNLSHDAVKNTEL